MPVFVRLAFFFGTIMTKFNYAVGQPWNVNEPEGAVGCYMMHNGEVFHGTMANAVALKDYCNDKLSDEELRTNPYRIYKLVEVTE
jgi:hypothetical protein